MMTKLLTENPFPLNPATHNYHYIYRFGSTIRNALIIHPRLLAIRIDLRFPDDYEVEGNKAMKSFMAAVTSRLEARYWQKKRTNPGKHVHYTELNYIWVREHNRCGSKVHYHVVLMFNGDAFNSPGIYWNKGNLTDLIIKSWLSALRIKGDEHRGLVYFPKHSCYRLNRKNLSSTPEFNKLMQRVEYMAKHRSKLYGKIRSMGCSVYDETELKNKKKRSQCSKQASSLKTSLPQLQ